MKNFRNLIFLTFSAAAGLFLAGCGGDDSGSSSSPRFAYVTNGVDPFWTLAEVGANKAAADLGVEVDVMMPAGGAVEQKSMLEDLVSRGIDGIAVSPIDAGNQIDLLNMVAERSILITHDSDAPQSDRRVFIGVDNYDGGRMCGKLVKEALPEGGSIMILIGRMEQDNAKRRRQGVIDELLDRPHDPTRFDPPGDEIVGEKYTILGTLTDQFDRSKAKANAEDTLARQPDLGAFVGLFAYNPPAALEALDQAGRLNEVKVVAFDEDNATLQGIVDGTVHGTVVQNPYDYGYQSVKLLKALFEGDTSVIPKDKFISVPARQIRKKDVEEFWADLKEKRGE
ncbi:MAG: ribose transport system substrate-binding protein [Verrucomicrobiales bacterium]|jgi:ribose transport system substrate-binding protein